MFKRLITILLILCIVASCSHSFGPNDAADIASDENAAGLPELPVGHHSAGLLETSRDGVQTFARSASAVDINPALQLEAAAGERSWAIWEFPAVDELRYLDVQLNLPQPEQQTGSVYVALADYSSSRWQIEGPLSGSRVLELDPARFTSPGNTMYAAVIAHDNAEALVQKLSLVAAHSNTAPTAQLNADLTSGNAPLSVQFDASGSTDPESDIAHYLWDIDGDGVFEGTSLGPSVQHSYSGPGIFPATVGVEDSEGALDQASVEISVNLPGNTAPTVTLSAEPLSGEAPLAVDFSAAPIDPDGSIVRRDWDFDGDGIWDAYDTGDQISHSYAATGSYNATVRVTDNLGAQAEDAVEISVTAGNAAPAALLTLLPNDIQLGEELLMDASQSSDSDGSIEQYEWDTDADGSFETNSGSGASISLTPQEPGSMALRVRVSDNAGATSVASAMLHVHGWKTVTPDTAGLVGIRSCLIEVNGNPAICYFDDTADQLRYVRALDAAGSAWGTPLIIGGSSFYSSMAVVEGCPAICYAALTDMLYVRALDADGTAWGPVTTVDSVGFTGAYNSLAVVNGKPAVSYYNSTSEDLRYAQATDVAGTTWGPPVTVDAAGSTGTHTSLAVVNGRPAISYHQAQNADLCFVRAADADGLSWAAPQTVDSAGTTGLETALLVVAGRPAISYFSSTGAQLRYIRASDADGSAWGSPLDIGLPGSSGGPNSLAVINGHPAVCFSEATNLDLLYFRALDSTGTVWGTPATVDSAGSTGLLPSLAEINGGPAMSFFNETSGDLLYAWGH